MSDGPAPTVTLSIDGRVVTVPRGTGLVEAAASIGVEIPVFCYEPRVGPAVGACRMCLVEVEGGRNPLVAACATQAAEGMVVSTISDVARDGQESVLEFLLINHPLDCPVCDKGGECPLQDHAFRQGPGESRFTEIKRGSDKPIPISPLIALDRERCILCYRCTRFSADVGGDRQLIPRERGANTVIATFEGRPYEGHFSGNVIELCPVGALTSTEFRFRGRPWENVDSPSTCTLCPVGCNVNVTVREGEVVRMLARQNDAVDHGWLCDRGRFSYTSLYSPSRILAPFEQGGRGRPAGNRPRTELSHEVAMEWLHERVSADASAGAMWVLSGSETVEEAFAVQRIAAATKGRVVALGDASAAGPSGSATIADIDRARHILVVGDANLVDVAPLLDIHVRAAMRAGARVTVASTGGTRLELEGADLQQVEHADFDAAARAVVDRVAASTKGEPLTEPGIVIYRDGELGATTLDHLAEAFQLPRPGSGFIAIAAASNARGLAALGIESATIEDVAAHAAGGGGIVLMGADLSRSHDREQWAPALAKAPWVAGTFMFTNPVVDVVDLVIPATGFQEKDGTSVSLEGRLQRLRQATPAPAGIRTELAWLSGLARRLGEQVPAHAAGAFRVAAAAAGGSFPAATYADIPEDGLSGVAGSIAEAPTQPAADELPVVGDGELLLHVAPFLYDGPDVAHAQSMQFLRSRSRVLLSRDDARTLGVARGDQVRVEVAGSSLAATVATSRRVPAGHARMHAGTCGLPAGRTGYHAARVSAMATAAAGVTG